MNRKAIIEHLPFLALVACLIIMGLIVAPHYGMTVDDQGLWDYGDNTVRTYGELFAGRVSTDPGPANLRYYGPAFLTAETIVENALVDLSPQSNRLSIWHFSIFVSFLIGVWALYLIGLELFDKAVALGIVAFYVTQPLLWGHAFINGKDIPFLSFFLLSFALGLRIEKIISADKKSGVKTASFLQRAKADLSSWSVRLRRTAALGLALLLGLTAVQLANPNWPENPIRRMITYAADNPHSLAGEIYYRWAQNAAGLPIEDYVQKALALAQIFLGIALILIWLLFLILLLRRLPTAAQWASTRTQSIPWRDLGSQLKSPIFWFASISLAIVTAIRVIGPLAGILVAGYLIAKRGTVSFPAILGYVLVATAGAYVLWPYLWAAPVSNFFRSLTVMSNFPQENHQLLNGHVYPASGLPRYFLPELLMLQFTVPLLVLALAGTLLLARDWQKWGRQHALIAVLVIWSGLPLAYSVVSTPPSYNNFRQWLFIVPPLFVLVGFGLKFLFDLRSRNSWYWATLIICAATSIHSIILLHPYEYIYYNAFVGGTSGAANRFEMDYWALALTEATRQLNEIAQANSRVVVWATNEQAVKYSARPDLLVESNHGGTYDVNTGYDYAVINLSPTRNAETLYPDAPVTVTIAREGVPFALVKNLRVDAVEGQ